jgi:uroporphyrinogen decarboxylase
MPQMLPKSALKACIAGEPTPIVPAWRFWTDNQFRKKYPEDMAAFHDRWTDDFHLTEIEPSKREMTLPYDSLEELELLDHWNCIFAESPDGVGWHPTRPIIRTVDEWERYKAEGMPTLPDTYAAAVERLSQERPDEYVLATVWRTYYERMFMLMGYEELMIEIATEGELFMAMRDDLRDFTLECIRRSAAAGADGIYLADDWGTQHRLMISPGHFAKYFKPHYGEMIELAHSLGMEVWMHSCGNITESIPHWIDIKLDVLSNLQALALDLPAIAEAYRGQICFMGGLDVQENLVNGTPETVRAEVKAVFDDFHASEGKYIASPCNTIMPETPVENVWALFEAFDKFGRF